MNTTPCVWNLEIGLQAGYILLNSNGQENCLPDYRITHTGARERGCFCWTTFNLKDTPHSVTLGSSLCGSRGDHPTLKSVGNSSPCHLTGCLSGPNSLLLQDLLLCSIDWRCLQSINTKRDVGGRCWGQKRCTLERPSLGCRFQSSHFCYCRGCVWALDKQSGQCCRPLPCICSQWTGPEGWRELVCVDQSLRKDSAAMKQQQRKLFVKLHIHNACKNPWC